MLCFLISVFVSVCVFFASPFSLFCVIRCSFFTFYFASFVFLLVFFFSLLYPYSSPGVPIDPGWPKGFPSYSSTAEHSTVQYSTVPYSAVQIGLISCVSSMSFCSSSWRAQLMAPKATKVQIDARLDELRQFVRANQEMLAARRGTTLLKSFRQRRKKERASGAIPPTRRPRTSAIDVEGSFNCYGKERSVRSMAEISIDLLQKAWNDEDLYHNDDDLVIYHKNVVVRLLLDHNLVMDVMERLCDDGDVMTYEIDFPQIQSYVIDLRNMFVNTTNWSGGDSAYNSWKELNVVRQLQTQAEPASRLLRDMLVVVLNRIQQVFSFVSPYYHTHRLRLAPPGFAFNG